MNRRYREIFIDISKYHQAKSPSIPVQWDCGLGGGGCSSYFPAVQFRSEALLNNKRSSTTLIDDLRDKEDAVLVWHSVPLGTFV